MSPAATATGPFDKALDGFWRRVFNFSFRMTMSREEATQITRETYLRAYSGRDKMPAGGDVEHWLLRIANHVLESRVSSTPEVSFDLLDDTLRSEATRTDVVQSLTHPQKEFLLWELKQGCMTSVVNCLSPSERVAFVLSAVMGLDDEGAARALGIKTSAYKVRLSRARKKVQDYLAPRCEHVDPSNPCRCPSRIGVALNRGFIPAPPSAEASLRKKSLPQFSDEGPRRDVMLLYNTLPDPDPPAELLDTIRAEVRRIR